MMNEYEKALIRCWALHASRKINKQSENVEDVLEDAKKIHAFFLGKENAVCSLVLKEKPKSEKKK